MSSEIKKVFKTFYLPDYEKEEEYLTEMHRNGWKFKKVNCGAYTFEKCEPENVVYKLDFTDNKKDDKATYITLFSDYGWEHIQDFNNFSYFRRNADSLEAEDTEIFSDNESRLEMMKKIINTRMIPLWIIFTVIIIPNLVKFVSWDFSDGIIVPALFTAYIVLFLMYTYIFIRCGIGFRRLKKKYTQDK